MGRLSGGASGAVKGAALGTSIMPGWGTAIGAGAGFIGGLFTGGNDVTRPSIRDNPTSLANAQAQPSIFRTPSANATYDGRVAVNAKPNPGSSSSGLGGSTGAINYDAMRARALAPTRASYMNAMRNLSRQRALQGGYAPGYG